MNKIFTDPLAPPILEAARSGELILNTSSDPENDSETTDAGSEISDVDLKGLEEGNDDQINEPRGQSAAPESSEDGGSENITNSNATTEPHVQPVDTEKPRLVLADSYAKRMLVGKFEQYLEDNVRGSSILISGHRGGGKTTCINHAFVDVLNRQSLKNAETEDGRSEAKRPLLIYLPSASMIDAITNFNQSVDQRRPTDTENPKGATPVVEPDYKADLPMTLLVSIVEYLHKAVTTEVLTCVQKSNPELAAHMEIELSSGFGLRADNIRRYWGRILGRFKNSVLFSGCKDRNSRKQRMMEMLVLTQICDATRRVNGQLLESDFSSNHLETNRSADYRLTLGDVPARLGIVKGIFGSSWSRRNLHAQQEQFTALRDPKSLLKELTSIIENLKKAGLYPIFVLDEMDKLDLAKELRAQQAVHNLTKKIRPEGVEQPGRSHSHLWFVYLASHLKSFFQDHVLFCFVADRSFFQHFVNFQYRDCYTPSYSMFESAIPVWFEPSRLHDFLNQRLDPIQGQTKKSAMSCVMQHFLLIYRARMHPLEMVRQRQLWADKALNAAPESNGFSDFEISELVQQLSVEMLLGDKDLSLMLKRDPRIIRYAVDALYYIPRLFLKNNKKDRIDCDREFKEYLFRRILSQEEDASDANDNCVAHEIEGPEGNAENRTDDREDAANTEAEINDDWRQVLHSRQRVVIEKLLYKQLTLLTDFRNLKNYQGANDTTRARLKPALDFLDKLLREKKYKPSMFPFALIRQDGGNPYMTMNFDSGASRQYKHLAKEIHQGISSRQAEYEDLSQGFRQEFEAELPVEIDMRAVFDEPISENEISFVAPPQVMFQQWISDSNGVRTIHAKTESKQGYEELLDPVIELHETWKKQQCKLDWYMNLLDYWPADRKANDFAKLLEELLAKKSNDAGTKKGLSSREQLLRTLDESYQVGEIYSIFDKFWGFKESQPEVDASVAARGEAPDWWISMDSVQLNTRCKVCSSFQKHFDFLTAAFDYTERIVTDKCGDRFRTCVNGRRNGELLLRVFVEKNGALSRAEKQAISQVNITSWKVRLGFVVLKVQTEIAEPKKESWKKRLGDAPDYNGWKSQTEKIVKEALAEKARQEELRKKRENESKGLDETDQDEPPEDNNTNAAP